MRCHSHHLPRLAKMKDLEHDKTRPQFFFPILFLIKTTTPYIVRNLDNLHRVEFQLLNIHGLGTTVKKRQYSSAFFFLTQRPYFVCA